MTTYRIDLDRLNRHKVITYFHFVSHGTGYASLASVALALRWIGVPHLMPDWMTKKLRTAGLLSEDGELRFAVPEENRAAPYGPTYGFPLEGAEVPNLVTVNIAALDTAAAEASFKAPIAEGTKQDHMTALRSTLDILGLPFPAWALRRGPNRVGTFSDDADFPPATNMDRAEEDDFADMLGLAAE